MNWFQQGMSQCGPTTNVVVLWVSLSSKAKRVHARHKKTTIRGFCQIDRHVKSLRRAEKAEVRANLARGLSGRRFRPLDAAQGCGIKGFLPTSVIQGNPPLYEANSLWEALSVVSQKWSFPTALNAAWLLDTQALVYPLDATCHLLANAKSNKSEGPSNVDPGVIWMNRNCFPKEAL